MKKLFLIFALFIGAMLYKAEAQIHVNVNIGNQPVWGPVGYDYVDYYYLPDLDVYYNVPRQQFVYFDFGRWIFAASLPSRFGQYDLFNTYKVVINERNPWLRNTYYRNQYRGYRGRQQSIIRDSRDQKYFVIRNHPEHDRFINNQRQNNNQRQQINNQRQQIPNNNRNDVNRNYQNRGNDNRGNGNRGNDRGNDNRGNGNRGNDRGNDNKGNKNHDNGGNNGNHKDKGH
jgi:hypothetical protein